MGTRRAGTARYTITDNSFIIPQPTVQYRLQESVTYSGSQGKLVWEWRRPGSARSACQAWRRQAAPTTRQWPPSALVRIGYHQPHSAGAAPGGAPEEGCPESLSFRRPDTEAHNLPIALCVPGHGNDGRDGNDEATLALFEVGRIQLQIGPIADKRMIKDDVDAVADILASLADGTLADPNQPHRLNQVLAAPRRDATATVDPLRGSKPGSQPVGPSRTSSAA